MNMIPNNLIEKRMKDSIVDIGKYRLCCRSLIFIFLVCFFPSIKPKDNTVLVYWF
jgi:hypothetical protein